MTQKPDDETPFGRSPVTSQKAVAVPSCVPELTPVSYAVVRTIAPATTRKVLVRSYLRRVKGRKRRVRVFVYRLERVPPVRRLDWVVQSPDIRVKWYNVADYQRAVEAQKTMGGHEVGQIEMEIFHTDPSKDVIHLLEEWRNGRVIYSGEPTLFVWGRTKLPRGIKVYGRDRPFRMVRIWFWVYHTEKREYRLWARSVGQNFFESNFDESYAFAKKLYDQVGQDIEAEFSYLEVHELVAWTAYTLGEKARRADKAGHLSKRLGGSR